MKMLDNWKFWRLFSFNVRLDGDEYCHFTVQSGGLRRVELSLPTDGEP